MSWQLSWEQIKRVKQTVAFIHHLIPKKLPVDPLSICSKYDIKVKWDNEELDDMEDAATYYINGKYIILLNEDFRYKAHRLRWTISHELGHILLNHFILYDLTIRNTYKLGKENAWMINREANLFAEELLMPEQFIIKHININIKFLQAICDVAPETMDIRLKQIKQFIAATQEVAATMEDNFKEEYKASDLNKFEGPERDLFNL